MNKKIRKYIAAVCAVFVFACAAALPALAAGNSSSPSSASPGTSSASSSGSTGVGRQSTSSQVTVVFNLNGGTGMNTSVNVDKGTKVSEFKTPTKKGYKFVAWMRDGMEVSDSMPIDTDTTLKAEWGKIAVPSSSAAPRPSADSTDTHQQAIDQAASDAQQAISDPGTLSSENWGALLNSSQSAVSSETALQSSQVSSGAASAAGGFSILLAIGIALIVLGIAGVGVFIYLQFIRKSGGGKGGPGGSGNVSDDTAVFTDISSYSDGKRHNPDALNGDEEYQEPPRGQSVSPVKHPAPKEKPPVRPAAKPAQGTPRPAKAAPYHAVKQDQPNYLEKAQAKPVEGAKSDFDWEEFFNEDK